MELMFEILYFIFLEWGDQDINKKFDNKTSRFFRKVFLGLLTFLILFFGVGILESLGFLQS